MLSPGEIVPVDIEILLTATLFRAVETLSLIVQGHTVQSGTLIMQFDRLRNHGLHRLQTGGTHDAYLLIDTLD